MTNTLSRSITGITIAEAEKLNAQNFTPVQREGLVVALTAQVQQSAELRRLSPSLPLEPAIHFDPRLPGQHYPSEDNLLRLSAD